MKQEKLLKLLYELIKNSKRSDRELAKVLRISQPTVTRMRKVLEKEAIKQYTVIPNLFYLGFDILAFTFVRSKELVQPLWIEGKEWAAQQSNIVFVSTGQGFESDAIMVSLHEDYADFVRFYQNFRKDWGKHLQDFKIFIVSVSGSATLKPFSFSYLVDTKQKKNE
jgi:DNA-binding Lrp family transcriptional regulator